MGNRGTKSAIGLNIPFGSKQGSLHLLSGSACLQRIQIKKPGAVKAQRVDGSYPVLNFLANQAGCHLATKLNFKTGLRCTLDSFERNLSVINVLPNLSFSRHYTKLSLQTTIHLKLDPWFVTGFADAEGCFTVTFQKNTWVKNGYSISPRFKLALHKKDLGVLEQLKAFFCRGSIQSTGKNRDSFEFIVKSLKDIQTVIIPHFDKYPLVSQKRGDYLLFKTVITSMNEKEHLSEDGFFFSGGSVGS